MKGLSVKEIIKVCEGKLILGDENKIIYEFSKDSRTIKNGELYIGIKGEKFDGNDFWEEALKNGAIGCLIERNILGAVQKKYKDKIIIKVENSINAIQKLAEYKRSLYNIPVIAVTGSVGKTSTKDIIASVLSKKFDVLKTDGNLNNQIGVPLTLLKLDNHNAIVIELGMNSFGEISNLSKIVKPTISVITNIGTSHIGLLGSRENILKAKLEILDGMNEKKLIINNDNDLLNKWGEKSNINIIKYGIKNDSDIMAFNIVEKEEKSIYNILINNKKYEVYVPVGGKHFIENSLCAIAVAQELKIEINQAIDGIKEFKLSKNRMDMHKINNYTLINDTYNASLESVRAVLEYSNNLIGNRKIAVLGDVLELGDYSEEIHKKIGEEVVKNHIDVLITVGENAKNIAKRASQLGLKEIKIFDNVNETTEYLKEIIKDNDIIILKASNAMNLGEIYNKLKNNK